MKFLERKKKRIYLDYAAATPIRHSVLQAMKPFERDCFANASAIHAEGVQARIAVEAAREQLARVLKIRSEGVVFTGSGTESNNLAILGTIKQCHEQGMQYADMEVITTPIEHPSVGKVMSYLTSLGITIKHVAINGEGHIDAQSLKDSLSKQTVLVSYAYANSEIGVVQEVGKLARIVRAFEKEHDARIYVHIDAAQAPLWLTCEMDRLLVDIMTLDAGKCYGPKGVGVLAMRHGITLSPMFYGGPQESGLRPATENTVGIVGAVTALVLAQEGYEKRASKTTRLRDMMISELEKIDGVMLNGSRESRIANNVNVSVQGIDSEFAVIVLDEAGIACSTKSACSGAGSEGSEVVYAITEDILRAKSTIRFSLGEETTSRDVRRAVSVLHDHIEKTRAYHY